MAPKVLLTAEQIQRRVNDIGQQISRDYAGKNLMLLCVLPNGFVFAADLIRAIDIPVTCQFVQPQKKSTGGDSSHIEIHYGAAFDVKGKDVVLVVGLIQSGHTTEFLLRTVVGSNGGPRTLLLGEDGAIEVERGGPSIEPFLVVGGQFVGWGQVRARWRGFSA